jgi:hypothetical protein
MTGAPRNVGDGGYLFDRQGDLRAWMMYPCWVNCSDPLEGKLTIADVHPQNPEYVDLQNVSSETLNLEGALLEVVPNQFAFHHSDHLLPGQTFRMWMQSGDSGADVARSWRLDPKRLVDGGDIVRLRNYRGRVLSCMAWGTKHC